MIKKIGSVLLALGIVGGFVGCQNNDKTSNEQSLGISNKKKQKEANKAQKDEMKVFAAASMTEVLDELKEEFEKENPNISISFNFDSSGTLKTQIESGAEADVFVSAAKKQMDELEESDLIEKNTRIDLLENEISLAVSENGKDIKSFEDLETDKLEKIALGNEDVPVGQYSEEVLKNLGIWESIQDKVSFGSNVKEVTSWLDENVVDCGIVYKTDAKIAGLDIVAVVDDSMLENKVIYPAAVLKNSKDKDSAQKYLDFLQSDKASEIFEKYGFKPLAK